MTAPEPATTSTALPFDPLTDAGAAELRRRIDDATPRRLPRAELDGHVGLSSRELYELGVTVEPVGLGGVPSAVGGRILVVVGVVVGTLLVAAAASSLLDPVLGALLGDGVRRDTVDDSVESGVGLAVIFGLVGAAWLALARFGERRVRRGIRARRKGAATATPAADDPEARATVAVVREPGALRVALLWVRGDGDDAELLDVRTVVEERVPEDEPGRAEDVVSCLSEVALRADAARAVPRTDGTRARSGDADRARDADRATPMPAGRADRALVAAARSDLPAVDPRVPIPSGWDPEPLTDAGRAEMAARLVRARPLLWNPVALERAAVDARDPGAHRPAKWPTDAKRREPQRPGLAKGRRRRLVWTAWFLFAVWVVVVTGIDRADDPAGRRAVGYPALAASLLLFAAAWWAERRAPGRRLARSVRAAAQVPSRGLERGVPGPAGRVLVLHGTRHGRDRVELVHARPLDDEGRGRLQVRTLAWRELDPDDVEEPREVVQELWVIADDAGFATRRGERDAGTVQRINAALGRAAERRRALGLRQEPLAWAAAPGPPLSVLFVGAFIAMGNEEGLALSFAIACWPLLASVLLWRTARRIRHPGED